ncbi:MAG: hypothetical protein V3W20_10915 [Candidatus Neomarinimicrobiota bacterium]
MINSTIQDGSGAGHKACVTKQNALCVSRVLPPVPPVGSISRYRYFNKLLGSGGAGLGDTNQNVDGSVNDENFYISSHHDYDLYIMAIVVIIADSIVFHNNFGNVPPLTNGYNLSIIENGEESKIFDSAKTGGQMIAQSIFGHPYGDGATSFELSKWTGNDDAQTIVVPMHELIPGGIRIGRGTLDKLKSTVSDDLTGLTEFTVRVVGYRHYP